MKKILHVAVLTLSLTLPGATWAHNLNEKPTAQGISIAVGNPASLNPASLTPKKVDVSNLLGNETRSILTDEKFQAMVQTAVAAAQAKWNDKAEKLNLPKRGYSFQGLMEWVRLDVNQGNTGVDVELRIPSDFNSSGQPTLETVLSGYTDDEFVNLNEPMTRKTVYRD